MKKYFIAVFCLILLLTGCDTAAPPAPPLLDPVQVKPDTSVVERGDVLRLYTYEGVIAAQNVPLSFSSGGTVSELLAAPGQSVRRGDLLARLDTRTLEAQLQTKKDELTALKKTAEASNKKTALEIEIKKIELRSLHSYPARQKELEIEALELTLQQDRETQALEQEFLNAEIKELSARIKEASLYAPQAGTVVWLSSQASVGSAVSADMPLFYLADLKELTVQTERIPATLLDAGIEVYALAGSSRYALTPLPIDQEQDVIDMLEGRNLKSSFTASEPDEAYMAGARVLVCLLTDRRKNTLYIPPNALYTDENGPYVYLIEGNEKNITRIEIGLKTPTQIEVVHGLKEGDVVYVKN